MLWTPGSLSVTCRRTACDIIVCNIGFAASGRPESWGKNSRGKWVTSKPRCGPSEWPPADPPMSVFSSLFLFCFNFLLHLYVLSLFQFLLCLLHGVAIKLFPADLSLFALFSRINHILLRLYLFITHYFKHIFIGDAERGGTADRQTDCKLTDRYVARSTSSVICRCTAETFRQYTIIYWRKNPEAIVRP